MIRSLGFGIIVVSVASVGGGLGMGCDWLTGAKFDSAYLRTNEPEAGSDVDGDGACPPGYATDGSQCVEHVERLSAGDTHTCAIRIDGTVTCWGNNDFRKAKPPSGTFRQISAGTFHTCGVKTDGTVSCWGSNDFGRASPPSGTFRQVSARERYTCGVTTDGAIQCWGDKGKANPPEGSFIEVSAGVGFICGLRSDGTVTCGGETKAGDPYPSPEGTFIQVHAYGHACGVRTNGDLSCWGVGLDKYEPMAGKFTQVSVSATHNCGLRMDRTLVCWAIADNLAVAHAPLGAFRQVTAGSGYSCGVRVNSTLACRGTGVGDDVPQGQFQ